jgi:hypothetical protein
MRRPLSVALLAVGFAAIQGLPASGRSAQSGTVPITVTPRIGAPKATFAVTFKAPDQTGRSGNVERRYVVSATGPSKHGSECVDDASAGAPPTKAHHVVHVKLSPGNGQKWCLGNFHGTVDELESPYCTRGEACPLFVVIVKRLGRFAFTVRRDAMPPTFAGLQRAVQCFPGPMRPDEERPVGLSWDAAKDNVTPQSRIAYDIYMASTAGGEDFSKPNWTTVGKTSFETPSLPANRYFVVRARDRAGNEDRNRIERRAENPCV